MGQSELQSGLERDATSSALTRSTSTTEVGGGQLLVAALVRGFEVVVSGVYGDGYLITEDELRAD